MPAEFTLSKVSSEPIAVKLYGAPLRGIEFGEIQGLLGNLPKPRFAWVRGAAWAQMCHRLTVPMILAVSGPGKNPEPGDSCARNGEKVWLVPHNAASLALSSAKGTYEELIGDSWTKEIGRQVHSSYAATENARVDSLTFLFTDLKGSTELYERVGDAVAFDLVREHFNSLHKIVEAEGGAVVKTIGDSVMATFPTPDRALAAALSMRNAMRKLNKAHGREDLLLKIGIHEGPCLAVTLNERQDYFGQTVNIASRVQGLALTPSILATDTVIGHPQSVTLLESGGMKPSVRHHTLRGIASDMAIYEIP